MLYAARCCGFDGRHTLYHAADAAAFRHTPLLRRVAVTPTLMLPMRCLRSACPPDAACHASRLMRQRWRYR